MMLMVFDYVVLVVIVLLVLCGVWCGFVFEIFGLIGWIVVIVIVGCYVGLVVLYILVNWLGGVLM